MTRETVVLITLVVYKLVLVGIGFVTQSRTKTKEDFFLGGRKLGPMVAAISASASSSSAWTLLGLSGFAYNYGLSALWFFPSCVGGFVLNWLVVAPAMRRHVQSNPALTMTDVIVGDRSRPLANVVGGVASFLIIALFTIYVASQFQGAGLAFSESFEGMDMKSSVLLGAAIVLFYTLLGGFWAVSLTDTLQGLMMAFTAVVLPAVALYHVGITELPQAMEAVTVAHYNDLWAGRGFVSGLGFVVGVFGIGLAYPGQPHVVNRFIALDESDSALRSARRIAIGWSVVIYTGMILLGWCGRILFAGDAGSEGILVTCANKLLHPVVGGVMVAAVLSAIMSTADSQLLVAASAVVHDLGFKKLGERPLLWSRIIIAVICVVAIGVVFFGEKSIFDQVLFAFSAAGAAFGAPLVAICFRWRPSPARILSAMTLGVAAVLFANFVIGKDPEWKAHKMFFEYTVPILLSALIVFTSKRES